MSFTITLRQGPVRLVSQLPRLASTPASVRAFHESAKNGFFTSRTTALAAARSADKRNTGSGILSRLAQQQSRGYQQQYQQAVPERAGIMRKLLVGGAVFGGTLVATNLVFNRETREDGGMPPFERSYLNSTFLHTGAGVGIIALSVRQMVRSGFVFRLMATNPWVFALGGLGMSFATMIGARSVDPENYLPKYALWTAFNATQAAMVAPMMAFVPMPILARAGLYTVAMMGTIAFVGATAKQEKYLYIGGPLLAGGAIVLASGLAPLVLPVTAVRTLAMTEKIWLYGGLAVFGGFTLYDVQKVLYHARLAQQGIIKRDPVNESISLELDFLNIFVRMVQILMMQGNRRK